MGGGCVEKSRLKLTSSKVEVEAQTELGNIQFCLVWFTLSITTYPGGWVGCVSLILRLTQPKLKLKLRLSLAIGGECFTAECGAECVLEVCSSLFFLSSCHLK